jgi:transposase-like protein
MATKKRRNWTTNKKRAVLEEIAYATANGSTIQSVLEKHNISHGMYKRWSEEMGEVQPPSELPRQQNGVTPHHPTTLPDAIEALRLKRDMLNEVIADLERMVKL